MQTQEKKRIPRIVPISICTIALIAISFFTFTGIRAYNFSKLTQASPLSNEQTGFFKAYLSSTYYEQNRILKPLPYDFSTQKPDVYAESAILIDVSNGNILYEKDADQVIPPASMTKLFAMYVVDEAVSEGKFSYNDIIPLPPECWACNMPPHSSLMFLGEGQIVTLEELLLGLSICSGNDAAYALAYTVSGSMEAFIDKMNQVARDLGLFNTHFVESSGYSEENTTTAREMATFARVYLNKHPESLKKFHSVPSFTYPKAHNMAPGDVYGPQDFSNGLPRHITMGITQKNTNPLLDILEGCDGLKTGYIDESGYNLALTVQRDGTRFLSVTMRGPGNSTREGQAGRIHDGTELMEYAFSNFKDFYDLEKIKPYFVKIYGAKTNSALLYPAYTPESFTIPLASSDTPEKILSSVEINVHFPERLSAPILQGQECGSITVEANGAIIDSIPLVADRTAQKANFIVRAADSFIR